MHGVTKELHRLVKGSALLEADEGDTATPSERVYGRLLDELAERSGEQLRTRVVVDVIAGTSAGGINGVCLAKALAHNLPQDELPQPLVRARRHRRAARSTPLAADTRAQGRLGRASRAEASAPARRPDGALDLRRLPPHGRERLDTRFAPDAAARPAQARAVRDGDRLLRLRPPGPVRRPEPDPRHAAPSPPGLPLRWRRRARRLRPRLERRAHLRRPDDLLHPRGLPAGQLRGAEGLARTTAQLDLDRLRAAVLPALRAGEVPAGAGPGSSTAASSTTSRSGLRSRRSGSAPPTCRSTGACSTWSRIPVDALRPPTQSRSRRRSRPRSAA